MGFSPELHSHRALMVRAGNSVPSLQWQFTVVSLKWFSHVEVNTVYPKCLNFHTMLIFVNAPTWQYHCVHNQLETCGCIFQSFLVS